MSREPSCVARTPVTTGKPSSKRDNDALISDISSAPLSLLSSPVSASLSFSWPLASGFPAAREVAKFRETEGFDTFFPFGPAPFFPFGPAPLSLSTDARTSGAGESAPAADLSRSTDARASAAALRASPLPGPRPPFSPRTRGNAKAPGTEATAGVGVWV